MCMGDLWKSWAQRGLFAIAGDYEQEETVVFIPPALQLPRSNLDP